MIAFNLWSAGMINQLMSLEIAVGIGAMMKQPILLHRINDQSTFGKMFTPVSSSNRSHLLNKLTPRIQDLIQWNSKNWCLADSDLQTFLPHYETIDIDHRYVNCKEGVIANEADFNAKRVYLRLEPDRNYNLVNTLSTYCRFFFNRTQEVDTALAAIQWRDPYLNLAKKIAADLGKFAAIHVRLTDHAVKTFAISEASFKKGLNTIEASKLPLILSTDDRKNPWVVAQSSRFKFLDDLIIERWSEDFKQLPFHDEVVFGLICCLVMTFADDFIGTPGSTYSAYVHRKLHSRGCGHWRFFEGTPARGQLQDVEQKIKLEGAYSWTAYEQPRWWREWPESKLAVT